MSFHVTRAATQRVMRFVGNARKIMAISGVAAATLWGMNTFLFHAPAIPPVGITALWAICGLNLLALTFFSAMRALQDHAAFLSTAQALEWETNMDSSGETSFTPAPGPMETSNPDVALPQTPASVFSMSNIKRRQG